MKDLIICGKCEIPCELITPDVEIWMLGTDPRNFGDVYFELHGIMIKNHKNVIYTLPETVYQIGLPINNSISALLVYAYLSSYKNVTIAGCPMDAQDEYIQQRPSLAYCMGYLNAKGMNIKWLHMPDNVEYGKKILKRQLLET